MQSPRRPERSQRIPAALDPGRIGDSVQRGRVHHHEHVEAALAQHSDLTGDVVWQRECERWLPGRSVAVVHGRSAQGWSAGGADGADVVLCNYDILEAQPLDDEAESEEERQAVAAARADRERGIKPIPLEDVLAEFDRA